MTPRLQALLSVANEALKTYNAEMAEGGDLQCPQWAVEVQWLCAKLEKMPAPGLKHPDTVRLDHLIEWHHSICDYAEVGVDTPKASVDSLHFIFDRAPGVALKEAVRAAIDWDRVGALQIAPPAPCSRCQGDDIVGRETPSTTDVWVPCSCEVEVKAE